MPGYLEKPDAPVTADELEAFVARERYWVADWAAFAGHGAIADQVRFDREWSALRRTPPSAASGSSATSRSTSRRAAPTSTAHPELFTHGFVAGAPPDGLSAYGQLWGNPLYDWSAMRRQGYRWWIERLPADVRALRRRPRRPLPRLRRLLGGAGAPQDREARPLRRGPGRELFDAAERELGPLPLVAEDLGVITPPVDRLRDELGDPRDGRDAVRVRRAADQPVPPREPRASGASSTSATHDCDTALGWWSTLPRRDPPRDAGCPASSRSWELIEAALSSKAELAISQAQDILGLGSEARMNMPGTTEGNWSWRLRRGQLTKRHAARLRALTEASGRLPH